MSKFQLFPNALPIDAKEIGGGESGSGAMMVRITEYPVGSGVLVADKTFEEIMGAVDDGVPVFCMAVTKVDGDDINFIYSLNSSYIYEGSGREVLFNTIDNGSGDSVLLRSIQINYDDSITVMEPIVLAEIG